MSTPFVWVLIKNVWSFVTSQYRKCYIKATRMLILVRHIQEYPMTFD